MRKREPISGMVCWTNVESRFACSTYNDAAELSRKGVDKLAQNESSHDAQITLMCSPFYVKFIFEFL